MRALASHQCGSGSIPGPGVICGLSLLLVLSLAPRVFLRVLRISSLRKNQHSKFQFDTESVDEEPLCGCATANSYLFYLFYLLFYLRSPLDQLDVIALHAWLSKHKRRLAANAFEGCDDDDDEAVNEDDNDEVDNNDIHDDGVNR